MTALGPLWRILYAAKMALIVKIEESVRGSPVKLSTRSKETTIMDLNDDCLLEILKHLPAAELANVADVSTRLRVNAQQSFIDSKLTHLDVRIQGISLLQKARLIRNFGKLVNSFAIGSDEFEKLPKLISRYASLTDMEISRSNFFGDKLCPLRKLLPRLKSLSMIDCDFGVEFLKILAKKALQLEELNFDRQKDLLSSSASPKLQFHALKKLSFHESRLYSCWFTDFVFPHLEELKVNLWDTFNWETSTDFVQVIAHSMPNIRKLSLISFSFPTPIDNTSHIGKFKNLKSLELTLTCSILHYVNVLKDILANDISLESLYLHRSHDIAFRMEHADFMSLVTSLVNDICKMTHLQTLVMQNLGFVHPHHYYQICRTLPNLSHVCFACEHFDHIGIDGVEGVHTFENVLDVIRVCKNLENLCYLYVRKITIDATTFLRMVHAVGDGRKQLTIQLTHRCFTINVPRNLIDLYEPILRLTLTPFPFLTQFSKV